MERNQTRMQEYLSKLSDTPETNYFLWKATKRLKKRKGRKTFIQHLSKAFKPNSRKLPQEEENRLLSGDTIAITDIPISPFTVNEVKAVIKHLNPKKAPL